MDKQVFVDYYDTFSLNYSTSKEPHRIHIKETVRSSFGSSWKTMRHSIIFACSKYKEDMAIWVDRNTTIQFGSQFAIQYVHAVSSGLRITIALVHYSTLL